MKKIKQISAYALKIAFDLIYSNFNFLWGIE